MVKKTYPSKNKKIKNTNLSSVKSCKKNLPPREKNLPFPRPPNVSLGRMKQNILKLLKNGENPHSMERDHLPIRRSTIIEHLRGLRDKGLVLKGPSVCDLWSITESGNAFLEGRDDFAPYERSGVGATDWLQDRAHNIKVKFMIEEKPSDIEGYLTGWKKNDKMRNNVFFSKKFGGATVTYTGKSLIFQLPVFKNSSPEMALASAGHLAMQLKQKYEREIPGLSLGKYTTNAQVISQHHAIVGDPFARMCKDMGITFQDDYIDIDASANNIAEIEFKDKEKGHVHAQNYIEHVKDVILNDVPKMSEIAETMKNIAGKIQESQEVNHDTAVGLNVLTNFVKSQLQQQKPKNNIEPKLNSEPVYTDYFG